MSGGVTYLTMDYLDMCFQNNNWQFSSSKSQQVLLSRFHISLTCNTRNRKISRSEAGMSNMPCGESLGWRWPANALMFLACLNSTHTVSHNLSSGMKSPPHAISSPSQRRPKILSENLYS